MLTVLRAELSQTEGALYCLSHLEVSEVVWDGMAGLQIAPAAVLIWAGLALFLLRFLNLKQCRSGCRCFIETGKT